MVNVKLVDNKALWLNLTLYNIVLLRTKYLILNKIYNEFKQVIELVFKHHYFGILNRSSDEKLEKINF